MGVLKGRDGGVGEADIIPLRSAIARAVEVRVRDAVLKQLVQMKISLVFFVA